MNYADIVGGTWFPQGGMYSIINGIFSVAEELGVKFSFDESVTKINVVNDATREVVTTKGRYNMDVIIAGADYHHVETILLEPAYRSYSDDYWNKRVMAPSCLLYYVGVNKRLNNLCHHSLFFDVGFEQHGNEIYRTKEWPAEPLFYVSATSVTDASLAPEGCENLFFLIPVAAGLTGDDENLRERYFEMIVARFEERIGETITDSIVYKKSFAPTDFVNEYNSFRGNAYGLANTLMQTAIFKPAIRSKKVKNLFYTGQLTVPGPGVPPSLISGEVVAKEVMKVFGDYGAV
jgi:phytoene desaturase